jgi:hypothetical protein
MKITYYNSNILFSNIKLLRDLNIIKEDITDDYIKLFKECNLSVNQTVSIIDRTEANKFFIPCIEHTIPEYENTFNKSFKQLCEERAIQLLKTGKRLNVFWSGGIDSTTVLFSLLNKTNDLSQIRVILTSDSIMESGNMFDKLIKNKVKYILNARNTRQQFFKQKEFEDFDFDKELLITGTQLDNLYTILRLKVPTDMKYHHLPYEETLFKYANKKIVDFYNKSVKSFPKKIKSYGDFLKFYCFSFHWHDAKYTMNIGLDPKYSSLINSFYDTPNKDFEKWSICSEEAIITETKDFLKTKIPQRNLVYELTGDKMYSFGKGKGMSAPHVQEKNNWFFLLENHKTLTHSDLMNNYENIIL